MNKRHLHNKNIESRVSRFPVPTFINAGSSCELAFFISLNRQLFRILPELIISNSKQKLTNQPNENIKKLTRALTCDCQPGLHFFIYFESFLILGVCRGQI